MEVLEDETKGAYDVEASPLENGIHDPFAYLNAVIKGDHKVEIFGLASMENNLMVMKILEAAKASAASGEVVIWKEFYE